MSKSEYDFEVLIKPDNDVNSWYWEKKKGNFASYSRKNMRVIVRHSRGYLCYTKFNKKIGRIINDVMTMYEKEMNGRFPGKICVWPTDYYVLNKSDTLAYTACVIIDMD